MRANETARVGAIVAEVKSILNSGDSATLQTHLQVPLEELREVRDALMDRFESLSERKQESDAGQELEAEATAVEEYADGIQELMDAIDAMLEARNALLGMEISV